MEKDKDSIIEKVRKCLKLANNSGATEGEAIAAMAMARKLMDANKLSMSDVEVKQQVDSGAHEAEVDSKKAFTPQWEKRLVRAVDYLFDCRHYFSHKVSTKWTGWTTSICFVGVGQDPAVAAEAYQILRNIVRKMGSKHGYAGAALRDYCLGVADTLSNRAWKIKEASEKAPEMSTCKDLMVVKDQLVATHMKSLSLKPGRATNFRGGAEYGRGREDGQKVNLGFRKALK